MYRVNVNIIEMVEKVIQIKYGVTLNVDVSAKISEKKSCV